MTLASSADRTRPAERPVPGHGRSRTQGSARRHPLRMLVGTLRSGVVQGVLVVIGLIWLTPTVGLLVSSLRPTADEDASGWWTALVHPSSLTFSNYSKLLGNGDITHAFWNTVLISVPATAIVVIVAALAGYAFAWLEFPGSEAVFLVVVGMLVVPIQIGLLPIARLFGAIGLFGSIYGVILVHVAYGLPFAVFLLRNYFAQIPREMLEAARMDGGTEWTIFTRLILPVGKPALASLAIFQFLWVWNDMLVSLIFADSQSQPLTVALQSQMRQFGANIDVLAPGAFLSLVVPLIVFFAFQRHFVEGVMAGSVK